MGEQLSFRTEIERPRSLSYFPEQNATQVPLDAAIGIKFDKPIFKSSQSDSVKAKVTIEGNDYSFDVTLKDSTATVDFDAKVYVAGKQVTVELSKEVGTWIVNEEDVVIQSHIWSFTSQSSIPTVLSTSPVNNATKVGLSDSLVFTFDQNITLVNGFLVTIMDGSNSLAPSFIREQDDKLIIGTEGFTNGTTYTVTIGAGAVKNAQDLSNAEAVLSFRTIQSAPKPIAFSPENGANQVPLDASLSINSTRNCINIPMPIH
ncbi:MAG: Ig-like domain-containing protein [Bacteroidetes bacterium]|nr:Ig-like domain-containing protein [Bacteroidota bacterium]